jgi:hypothetical protein
LIGEGRKEESKLVAEKYGTVVDEIRSIRYILEDFGATVIFKHMGVIEVSPHSGMLSNKQKVSEYIHIYEEFVERCQEICDQNDFLFVSDYNSGNSFKCNGGNVWLNWKFSIKPKRIMKIK